MLQTRGRALLSVPALMGLYVLLALALKPLRDQLTVGGYTVEFSTAAALVLSMGVMAWTFRQEGSLASLGFFRPRSWLRAVALGAVGVPGIYAGAAVVVLPLVALGGLQSPADSGTLLVSGPNPQVALVSSLALMWVNAALCEEVLFRGFLLHRVALAFGDHRSAQIGAAAFTGLSFGVMHVFSQGLYGMVLTSVVGFLLGLLFLLGGRNLVPVVIAHGLINTLSFVSIASGG
ncbi:MAG: CPBP family intramembrane glutamic endopeptidase [Myxococcota bacterium]